MLGYAGDQEETFLESISSIISTPTLFFISSSELLLAIQLQQAKVDYYMSLKDKKTVYSMVMLETLKFLLKGEIGKEPEIQKTTTMNELKLQVYQVACETFETYISQFPIKSALPSNSSSDLEIALLNDALAGDESAMIKVALLLSDAQGKEYWLKRADEVNDENKKKGTKRASLQGKKSFFEIAEDKRKAARDSFPSLPVPFQINLQTHNDTVDNDSSPVLSSQSSISDNSFVDIAIKDTGEKIQEVSPLDSNKVVTKVVEKVDSKLEIVFEPFNVDTIPSSFLVLPFLVITGLFLGFSNSLCTLIYMAMAVGILGPRVKHTMFYRIIYLCTWLASGIWIALQDGHYSLTIAAINLSFTVGISLLTSDSVNQPIGKLLVGLSLVFLIRTTEVFIISCMYILPRIVYPI